MHFSIATRAKRNGIVFEPHELSPLGIDEGAKCWGLWVEGRGFDEHSRLATRHEIYRNESPHLAVSPIHPTFWPTAFGLDVYMQRRQFDPQSDLLRCDAFLGLTDALRRCDVNVLFINTAQLGYDLVCVSLTCDFPLLRNYAAMLLADADSAGEHIERVRNERAAKELSDNDFAAACSKHYAQRVGAFQNLGRLLLPRLVELECRLNIMDNKRFHHWTAGPGASKVEVESHGNEALRGLIVGSAPADGEDAKQFIDSLESPWFLNQKVAAAGENSYFLSYGSVTNAAAIEQDLSSRLKVEEIRSRTKGLDKSAREQLYNATLQTLRTRQPHKPLLDTIPRSKGGKNDDRIASRSATSERLINVSTPKEFEEDAFREFFQRQALVPVRVTAMPSLAYARFWALSGCVKDSRGEPMEFRFKDKLLRPISIKTDRFMRMNRVFEFLNTATRCKEGPDFATLGEFGPEMGVFANLHGSDRFLRLRFAREALEGRTYLNLTIALQVRDANKLESCSMGLLYAISRHLLSEHFRVERCSNQFVDGDERSELSEWLVVAKAIDDKGFETCKKIVGMTKTEIEKFQATWADAIHSFAPHPASWDKPKVTIAPGFVPRDR